MILHRYFARKFFLMFWGVFAVFFLLLAMLELIEQLRGASEDATFSDALTLTLLSVPSSLYRILPLIMILATISLFLGLARTSEMVVTRASGRSAFRALVAPLCVAFGLGLLTVTVFNPIVSATSKEYERRADEVSGRVSSALSLSSDGFWLRQGVNGIQTVIHAREANLEGTELRRVSFLTFDNTGVPVGRLEANRASLKDGYWALSDIKSWTLTDSNPEATAELRDTQNVPTDLTKARIQDSFGAPSAIPIWDLPAFIEDLEKAGFAARSHRLWLQMELVQPLLFVAMVLIGAGFTMRHVRFGRTGALVLSAVLLGFGLYFLRNFAQILGENGQIPLLLAAWAPPAIGVLLPVGLLLHLEDG